MNFAALTPDLVGADAEFPHGLSELRKLTPVIRA